MVRDCKRLNDELAILLSRGDIGLLGRPLVDLAVTSAVVTNALELIPRTRVISDTLARELNRRLVDLDDAVAETLRLPADGVLARNG
jgi:hypothetical protein